MSQILAISKWGSKISLSYNWLDKNLVFVYRGSSKYGTSCVSTLFDTSPDLIWGTRSEKKASPKAPRGDLGNYNDPHDPEPLHLYGLNFRPRLSRQSII